MESKDVKDLADAIVTAAKRIGPDTTAAVAFAELRNDFKHMDGTVAELKETVYEKHDPVIIWTKDFIESYRKVITAVVVSAIITGIGLFIQLYTLLQKGP